MQRIECRLLEMNECAEHIWHIRLDPAQPVPFKPGQYLQVVMGEKDKRPFSIASSPTRDGLELQIGATPGNPYPGEVLERLRSTGTLTIEIPQGKAWLREESSRPILLIAGGTGYSYARALLQYLMDTEMNRPVYLYWGVRHKSQLYEGAEVLAWANEYQQLNYIPVVEHPQAEWLGRTGMVHEAVLADFASLDQYDIYVAGRFEMAAVVRQTLRLRGVQDEHLFGDAYQFI
ncbi:NAD(P)H-flavin reductase [Pseudaeromonas pectinilytica]